MVRTCREGWYSHAVCTLPERHVFADHGEGTRDSPVASTEALVADESKQVEVSDLNYHYVTPTSPLSLSSTTTGTLNADSNILRQELQRVHGELNAATAATDTHWRQQDWHVFNVQQTGFMNAATTVKAGSP